MKAGFEKGRIKGWSRVWDKLGNRFVERFGKRKVGSLGQRLGGGKYA